MPCSSRAQAAAFLANIAYADAAYDFPSVHSFTYYLKRIPQGPETNGPWSLVWGPAANDGIVLYVARGADGGLCVAFRGTNTDDDVTGFFENIFVDLDVPYPVPWPYAQAPVPVEPPPSNPDPLRISPGTNQALALAQAAIDPKSGLSLIDFLRQSLRERDVEVIVTGHSLGGGLAVVATAWLHAQLRRVNVPPDPALGTGAWVPLWPPGWSPRLFPCTFAAPTIANGAFACWFRETFEGYEAFVNAHDVVPMAWGDLGGILGTYPGFLDVPTIVVHEPVLAAAIEVADVELGDAYRRIPDTGPPPFRADLLPTHSWTEQAEHMHSMEETYFPHVLGHPWTTYMPSVGTPLSLDGAAPDEAPRRVRRQLM